MVEAATMDPTNQSARQFLLGRASIKQARPLLASGCPRVRCPSFQQNVHWRKVRATRARAGGNVQLGIVYAGRLLRNPCEFARSAWRKVARKDRPEHMFVGCSSRKKIIVRDVSKRSKSADGFGGNEDT